MRTISPRRQKWFVVAAVAVAMVLLYAGVCHAEGTMSINFDTGGAKGKVSVPLKIIFLLTILSLAPAILIMVTSFTRIIVILSFLKHALGTGQMPPNQLMVGLALFLTYFVMMPVWTDVNTQALQPLSKGEITEQEAFTRAVVPIREFMFKHVREKDLAMFIEMAGIPRPEAKEDVGTYIVIPAFVTSELKTAFQIGFVLFLPFLVIDMAVASVLMSMGMMMVPPVMVSLPLKVLLFVLVDGWRLVIQSAVLGFR